MKKKWLRLISFCLMVMLLFGGYYAYSMFSFLGSVTSNKPFSTGEKLSTAEWAGNEQVNILFLGVDARDKNERPRSDTMLLASINPQTKQLAIFSIMRDTYVDIPGIGQSKINAAFAQGGPELMIDTIQDFLDTKIHYYVATDFEGFAKIVDSIGGVDVNVAERMVHADDGIHDILLEAGPQHLDGEHALMYVRYRGGVRADFDRTERQRELVKLVAQELKSPGMLLKMPSILKEVKPYVQTNLGGDDLVKLAALGLKLDTSTMKTEQLPPDEFLSETTNMYGEQILWPDVDGVRGHYQQIVADTGAGADSTGGTGHSAPVSGGTAGETSGSGNGSGSGSNSGSGNSSGTGNGSGKKAVQKGPQVEVSGEYVNLRKKPGTEYDVIGKVFQGDVLTLVEDLGEWYYVMTPEGMYGYVSASLMMKL